MQQKIFSGRVSVDVTKAEQKRDIKKITIELVLIK